MLNPEQKMLPNNPVNAGFTFVREGNHMHVETPELYLSPQHTQDFAVTVRKLPIVVEKGTEFATIYIDETLESLRLFAKARELRSFPERERPREVVNLVRSVIQYAYPNVTQELEFSDPERFIWVSEHIIVKNKEIPTTKLSELVRYGYGVCKHFATLTQVLGQEAGLSSAYIAYHTMDLDGTRIKNVYRRDNNEALFKSVPVGEDVTASHAWNEFLLEDGTWLPVDTTVNLIGDNKAELQTFHDANYQADLGFGLSEEGLPSCVVMDDLPDLRMRPGEGLREGTVSLLFKAPTLTMTTESGEVVTTENVDVPQDYRGSLGFTIIPRKQWTRVNIDIFGIAPK